MSNETDTDLLSLSDRTTNKCGKTE